MRGWDQFLRLLAAQNCEFLRGRNMGNGYGKPMAMVFVVMLVIESLFLVGCEDINGQPTHFVNTGDGHSLLAPGTSLVITPERTDYVLGDSIAKTEAHLKVYIKDLSGNVEQVPTESVDLVVGGVRVEGPLLLRDPGTTEVTVAYQNLSGRYNITVKAAIDVELPWPK
ncbi:MAG: hypothetical protein LBH70_05595 [Spirochaetaceae bacterium]|jgi:hypothetical protein|nr:hypothetical protein [Spirochaetaceae bacterium]